MCFYYGVKVNFGSLWEAVSYFSQLAKKYFGEQRKKMEFHVRIIPCVVKNNLNFHGGKS